MVSKVLSPSQIENLLASRSVNVDTEPPYTSEIPRLLATLDRQAREQLMEQVRYEPGEVVFQEGERGTAMCLIWSGRVAVLKGDFDSPTILGFRGPGEIIGEMALLDNQPRSASVVALEPLRLLRIAREKLQEWMLSAPDISFSIMQSLSSRLREADNVRDPALRAGRQLVRQVSELQSEKEHLLELQRVRQETSDLIVHDLRNPLSVIYGTLNLLGMVLPEEIRAENQALLDIATVATGRMRRLVDSLLDVAKLETGEMQLSLSDSDLGGLLKSAVSQMELGMQTAGVHLITNIPDTLPPVLIDVDKLERVMTNLLDNALKYTPRDGQITVAAEVQKDSMVISVSDTGSGIPPEDRKRIFERFAQVEGESRQVRGLRGFGLGLTFCRATIEAHGGAIWAEAGPKNVGSRFVFSLPLTTE